MTTAASDTRRDEITHADGRAVRKGLALLVLAISQLMVVLDVSIVNVALPDIARDLQIGSQNDLSWIVTGYTLTFGGFLLLGGKLADRLGRRNVFIMGAALFAISSLLGGIASNLGLLVAARLLLFGWCSSTFPWPSSPCSARCASFRRATTRERKDSTSRAQFW